MDAKMPQQLPALTPEFIYHMCQNSPMMQQANAILVFVFEAGFGLEKGIQNKPVEKLAALIEYFKKKDGNIERLKRVRSDSRFGLLHFMCCEFEEECVSLLIKEGFDVNAPKDVYFFQRKSPIFQMLMQVDYQEKTAADVALNIAKAYVATCEKYDIFLDLNEKDAGGAGIAHYLARFDAVPALEYFLKQHDRITQAFLENPSKKKFISYYDPKVCPFFDVNSLSCGVTPLTMAKEEKSEGAIKLLLAHGGIEKETSLQGRKDIAEPYNLPAIVSSGHFDFSVAGVMNQKFGYAVWVNEDPNVSVPLFDGRSRCVSGLAATIRIRFDKKSEHYKVINPTEEKSEDVRESVQLYGIITKLLNEDGSDFEMIVTTNPDDKEILMKHRKFFGFEEDKEYKALYWTAVLNFEPTKQFPFILTSLEAMKDEKEAEKIFNQIIEIGKKLDYLVPIRKCLPGGKPAPQQHSHHCGCGCEEEGEGGEDCECEDCEGEDCDCEDEHHHHHHHHEEEEEEENEAE